MLVWQVLQLSQLSSPRLVLVIQHSSVSKRLPSINCHPDGAGDMAVNVSVKSHLMDAGIPMRKHFTNFKGFYSMTAV